METIHSITEMREWSRAQRAQGITTSLVPTMGALHEGHMSLIELAQAHSDKVIVSIYVNPTQFAAHEDYGVYPRGVENDVRKLKSAGVAVAFVPATLYHSSNQQRMVVGSSEHQPGEHDTFVQAEHLQKPLCGQSRPHFFRGVATVVAKLFNITEPDVAVFGKKDFQQLCIIRAMVRDLNFAIKIVGGPILREEDGLAASSRNSRLGKDAREKAPCIYQGLSRALQAWKSGEKDIQALKNYVVQPLEAAGATVDYVELVNAHTVASFSVMPKQDALMAVAAFFPAADGTTVRLIDNIEFEA